MTAHQTDKQVTFVTIDGPEIAKPGDWIVSDVDGLQHVCKPDLFKLAYEPVDDCSVDSS